MGYIRLRACNWGLATLESFELMDALHRRHALRRDAALSTALTRGTGANPCLSRFGEASILMAALERAISSFSQNDRSPTPGEIERLLDTYPELRRSYAFRRAGRSWTLKLKSSRARLKASHWASRHWKLIFETPGGHELFPIAGDEFHPLLRLFEGLNGDQTEAELRRRFAAHEKLVARFLRFSRKLGLLETGREPLATSATHGAEVELVSHSCLRVDDGKSLVLVDPVFFVPPPYSKDQASFRRMDELSRELPRVSAVVLTHNHWDHLHLPTLARLPRSTPIYVPEDRTHSPFDPSVADFVESLGFTRVERLKWWRTVEMGGITLTATPFFGEWFGPKSGFSAFTYLLTVNGRTIFGSVDADRDERGSMEPTLKRLSERAGGIDYFFFCSSAQRHANPVFCGAPYVYTNSFSPGQLKRMRYHPDWKTVARWCRILKPRCIIPYAEFIFHPSRDSGRRRPRVRLGPQLDYEGRFRSYWRARSSDAEPRLGEWRRDLERLRGEARGAGTHLLMLGPGEAIAIGETK